MAKKNRNILVRAAALILALFLLFPSAFADAATSSELKSKLAGLESREAEVKEELKKLEDRKDAALEKKELIDREVGVLQEEIDVLEEAIDSLSGEIDGIKGEVDHLNAEIDALSTRIRIKEKERVRLYEAFKIRIRVMHEEDLTSYAGLLFGAENIADLLSRIEAMANILTADRTTMQKLETMKSEIEKDQEDLSADVAELETKETALEEAKAEKEESKKTLDAKMEELVERQTAARRLVETIKGSIADNQALLEDIASREEKMQEEIRAAAKAEAEAARKAKEEAERDSSGSESEKTSESSGSSGSGSGSDSSGVSLSWPMPGRSRITSGYGYRTHPVTGRRNSFHSGIDIPAPSGTDIHCAAPGTVIKATYNVAYGNMIVVDHGNGISTLYAHMRSRALYSVGDKVSRGTVLGYVGMTGWATGYHLHFGVLKNGDYVSPLNYVSP